jgi:WD40 repeat protein
MLKVYDISDQMQLNLVLSIPLEKEFSICKISPVNKNFIFLKSTSACSLIEIKDSFKENYQTQIIEDKDINLVKSAEENELDKRYELLDLEIPFSIDDFVDFAFDMYNNIYIALTSGEVHLYDQGLNRISVNVLGEMRDCIRLPKCATAICMTQRYLLCLQDNGRIACINIYIPEKEMPSFKPSIGVPENYRTFEIEKELTPSIYSNVDIEEQIEPVRHMSYDPEMRKIVLLSRNSMSIILMKGEILVKDKEKEVENDDRAASLNNEVEAYEENKFHCGKVIGVKELGNTSQFISIGEDGKVIIWELSSRTALYCHSLEFTPTCFDVDFEGNLIFVGTSTGVLRIYDISSRGVLKMVYVMKYSNFALDKILIHPTMKFVSFFARDSEDHNLYFISGEPSKNFQFLGYIAIPTNILDVCVNKESEHGDVIVLIRNFLLSYKIQNFIHDHKHAIESKSKNARDLFSNFELKCDIRGRKVDGDLNLIIKNPSLNTLWLTGSEKYLRMFQMPQDSLEVLKKNSKSPTENPMRDHRGHDLEVTCGIVQGNVLITGGKDGMIQFRREEKEKVEKLNRSHSYIKEGISCIYYSSSRRLLFSGGKDGSIFIIAEAENCELPYEPINNLGSNEALESLDLIEHCEDNQVRSFVELIQEEHDHIIHRNKKTSGQLLKAKIEDIKSELNKLINENSKLEEIEKLSKEEMIIDFERIEKESKEGVEMANEKIKHFFRELCEKELKRAKLFEKTYDLMRVKEDNKDNNGSKTINNNIRIISSSGGDKILKSYPIRKISEKEHARMNYVKQLRLMELNEKYKRRQEKLKETIDATLFSTGEENYIVNRAPVRIQLVETEIRQQDVADTNSTDGNEKLGAEGGQFKASKYKLQRHPYADEISMGTKQEENSYQVNYKPDEQLLREDLVVKYNTVTMVDVTKGISDVEFTRNLIDIDTASLLYSPFELHTNFRMRNQIYLLIDIIQTLKHNFNREFKAFITERNTSLEKFNANKIAIDSIREILTSLGSDVIIEDYSYAINPHEDNEWVEKIDENEIRVPRYFSREEKLRKEEEMRKEEERIKALQGDTLEMRGLKYMIEPKSMKSKQNQSEEGELIKESWMDKEKKDMTEDELRKYTEYIRKEKEINDRKEKIRSQNMTKLNSHKMEIDTIKTEMDSKFLKILKKKLYYDYRVTEQELTILALSRTMEYRDEIKLLLKDAKEQLHKLSLDEIKIKEKNTEFDENYKRFEEAYHSFLVAYNERNKNNKLIEAEKNMFDVVDIPADKEEILQKIRSDPFYFQEREKIKQIRKYGNKNYKEISSAFMRNVGNANQRNLQEENINLINQKYYYDYKNDQMVQHKGFLENEEEKISEKKKFAENDFKKFSEEVKKSKLNFDLCLRLRKGQDEITGLNGPQEFIDEGLLIDHMEVEDLNRRINNIYTVLQSNLNIEKDHIEILQYLDLENIKTDLTKHEIELKLRYLKLTRVTKKVQEIVTGREDIDQQQIALVYDQKKRNLEENKNKRIETMNDKMREIYNEIEKKKRENLEFIEKSQKLNQEVKLKEQIIDLDNEENESDRTNSQNPKSK